MKITIESTSKFVTVLNQGGGDVQARLWEGYTESGIPVHCYVTRIAAGVGADLSQFERELRETRAPSADVAAIPMRMIL